MSTLKAWCTRVRTALASAPILAADILVKAIIR